MTRVSKYLLVLFCSLAVIGCKSKTDESDIVIPAQTLYNAGVAHLEKDDYKKAAEEFEKVFFQHPGSDLSPKAELMQAYSLYKAKEYDEAVDVLDIFIKLHPRHENISYAYYLKALASYTQISEVDLDQSKTENAMESLQEVMSRFPGSSYALDAQMKVKLTKDHLAGHEMLIGRYYLSRKNPIAAIPRFQTVIQQYNATSYVPEALYRLIESTISVGLIIEAKKYANILDYNYKDSSWNKNGQELIKSYKK